MPPYESSKFLATTFAAGVVCGVTSFSSDVCAEFALNFLPVAPLVQPMHTHWGIGPPLNYWNDQGTPEVWDDRYTRWRTTSGHFRGFAGPLIQGQSPFLVDRWSGGQETPELVTDQNGKQYWHVVVLDPYNDFKQEVFIEAVAGIGYGSRLEGTPLNHSHSIVDPSWSNYYDIPGSASRGGTNDLVLNASSQYAGGNQSRIFSPNAGNGSGDPRKVIMHQTIDFGELNMVFLKASYDKKPLIQQTLLDNEIDAYFEVDMRHMTYGARSVTPAGYQNRMVLTGDDAPANGAAFNANNPDHVQYANVSAGDYLYVLPSDGSDDPTEGNAPESGGTYSYAGGSFDHYGLTWGYYLDPASFSGTTTYIKDNYETSGVDPQTRWLTGISGADRVDIKTTRGWEYLGGIDFAPVDDGYDTYIDNVLYVNPWSYAQENLCDYANC